MSNNALRKVLIELYQRTIDYDDPDRQYIGFMADKSIEIVSDYLKSKPQLPVTRQQLADYCGVSRQTVHAWLKNPNSIKLGHLLKILELEDDADILNKKIQ